MAILSKSELGTLMEKHEGWCVSIFVPTHRAGAEAQQDPIRLKNLLGHAEELLIDSGLRSPEAKELLRPGEELVPQAGFWRRQSDGLAIFISPKVLRIYRLPLDLEELVVVGDRFHIKPLLPLLSGDGRFYALALSQNEIRVLQGTRHSVDQVEVEDAPRSLSEALKWDDPERRLQWHTRTGTVADGVRAAIFHGHGVASADDPKDYIRRYLRQIDNGLSDLPRGEQAPLVLAGVDYALAIYREVNIHSHLMDEGIAGNPEELSDHELHKQAWDVVRPYFQKERNEAAALYRQLDGTGSALACNDIKEVAPAAYYGRVETVFVALGLQIWGSFDVRRNAVEVHGEAEPGDEDLLDLVAVHTLLNGGVAYAVELDEVPAGGPLAAVFRH